MIPFASKTMREYLVPLMPGVRIAFEVPASMPAKLVTIAMVPAGSHEMPRVFGWRRLIFRCYANDDEIATAELAETVRDHLVESAYARIGFRKVVVIGEPGRFDDPEVNQLSFQVTVDALARAQYN